MDRTHVLKTIEMLREDVRKAELELVGKKKMVNSLAAMVGEQAVYASLDIDDDEARPLRSDEYYGKPLAQVVRTILERRGHAAPPDWIYERMIAGGFQFEAKSDDTALRSMSISLAKNTNTFHRIPNGDFGLKDWYPDAPAPKARPNGRSKAQQTIDDLTGDQKSGDAADNAAMDAEGFRDEPAKKGEAKKAV